MSSFRIDHLDGPRYDPIEGRYYGAGSANMGVGRTHPADKHEGQPEKKKIKKDLLARLLTALSAGKGGGA